MGNPVPTAVGVVEHERLHVVHRSREARLGRLVRLELLPKGSQVGGLVIGEQAEDALGGVGLTQSFALELAPFRIKVNAVCPGNFYEGPLWSNPENGLFLQYLHAGKVPGAKTVEDVRKYYMDQVPMRKGTGPEDVTKAVLYLIEQTCETGQAVPVTGGQVMLS